MGLVAVVATLHLVGKVCHRRVDPAIKFLQVERIGIFFIVMIMMIEYLLSIYLLVTVVDAKM